MHMGLDISRRGFVTSAAAPLAAREGPSGAPPNLVLLISDDHSHEDLGVNGNPGLATPNLDRLAAGGMRFTHCFATSPQCSPNRSAILTGATAHTTSTSRLHTPMPPWETTIVDLLKRRGYFTAAAGKVHQGKEFDRRWDYYAGAKTPLERFFDAAPRQRPFFLHVGFTDPHRPYQPGAFSPPHDPAKVRVPGFLPDRPEIRADLANYAGAIARLDGDCGRVLESLRSRGLLENTLVIFTADNGMPFPRAKGTCYDPGVRVPMIASWPGRIAPGSVCGSLVSHIDLAPTWLAAAGAEPLAKAQGRPLLDLLSGRTDGPRTEVFAERNWHDNFDPIRAVRTARHKLIFNAAPHFPYRPAWDLEDSPTWQSMVRQRGGLSERHLQMFAPARPVIELYDLEKDPDEFNNVAEDPAYRDVRRELAARLSRWMQETYDYLPPGVSAPGEPGGRNWPRTL
jgi:arylsulfatase A-like enzyme